MMKIESAKMPTLFGGPLNGIYKFEQLHYHWGANDSVGSEDKIDGKSFPLELHMVFFKEEYGNAADAMNYFDGLCVLACIFEVNETGMDPLFYYIKKLFSA